MAMLKAFFVNLSKIPDQPLEVVFAHCEMTPYYVLGLSDFNHLKNSKKFFQLRESPKWFMVN